MQCFVFVYDRTVDGETKFDLGFVRGRVSFYRDHFAFDLHLFPSAFVTILSWISRVDFFHVEVLLIDSDDGESEPYAFVMACGDSGKCWFSCPDHVPSGPDQMNEVSKRRQPNAAMRIVGENGLTCFGYRAAYHPIIGVLGGRLTGLK